MFLFFDTETTGLKSPHIVQLAALLTEEDGRERACLNVIIQPEGWTIPDEAAAVHGITTDIATRTGIPVKNALSMFLALWRRASIAVAHNFDFDKGVMEKAFRDHTNVVLPAIREICTKDEMTPVCNLPPTERMLRAGFNKPKPPKLEEAYRHFFGADLDGAHDAMVDVRACRDVFFALRDPQLVRQEA